MTDPSYYSEGNARMTLFASSGNARTFNFQAGDVSYVPATYGVYPLTKGHIQVLIVASKVIMSRTSETRPSSSLRSSTLVSPFQWLNKLSLLTRMPSDKFQDVSLSQWLALTPPALVQAHLNLDDDLINHLNKTKQVVVGPASS